MTLFEREGRAPILTAQFNTVNAYRYVTMSGQMNSIAGYKFILMANPSNVNNVLIGGALGAMTFPMEPGFGLSLEIENLNELFANIQSGDELHILVLSEV